MARKVAYLVKNSEGLPVKACSTLKKAQEWAKEQGYQQDFRELVSIVGLEIDGDTWGESFDIAPEEP